MSTTGNEKTEQQEVVWKIDDGTEKDEREVLVHNATKKTEKLDQDEGKVRTLVHDTGSAHSSGFLSVRNDQSTQNQALPQVSEAVVELTTSPAGMDQTQHVACTDDVESGQAVARKQDTTEDAEILPGDTTSLVVDVTSTVENRKRSWAQASNSENGDEDKPAEKRLCQSDQSVEVSLNSRRVDVQRDPQSPLPTNHVEHTRKDLTCTPEKDGIFADAEDEAVDTTMTDVADSSTDLRHLNISEEKAESPIICVSDHAGATGPTSDLQTNSCGIFDDAEEDETFDFSMVKAVPKKEPDPLRYVNPGFSSQKFGQVKLGGSHPATTASDPALAKKGDQKSRKQDTKKRKHRTRSVYVGKKEEKAATDLVTGLVDLSLVLSPRDCRFLGEELWIYTVQQLEVALEGDHSDGRKLRYEILAKLIQTKYLTEESGDELKSAPLDASTSSKSLVLDDMDKEIGKDVTGASRQGTKDEEPGLGQPGQMESDQVADRALRQLVRWQKTIQSYKTENPSRLGADFNPEQFPLDGPVKSLIPLCTFRFISSVNIQTVHDFLSLRRTETGVIVEMFSRWRKRCGMKRIDDLNLGKHLLGLGARFEAAIGRVPFCCSDTRKWMGSPMVLATGAAKDFLIDEFKAYSAQAFIDFRTKDIADRLSAWRSRTGLQPLKGTGNVAMISGWKTMIKDGIEVEKGEGVVIKDVDFRTEVEATRSKSNEVDKHSKIACEVPTKNATSSSADKGSLSDILGTRASVLLKDVRVFTTDDFLGADEKLLLKVAESASGSLPGEASLLCKTMVDKWTKKVKKHGQQKVGVKEKPALLPLPAGETKLSSKKAYSVLSVIAKEFLTSINLRTSESFLAHRTTDVANDLIKWRLLKKLPALKGQGAVATISGWKKQVRDAAQLHGDESLASINKKSYIMKPKEKIQKGSEHRIRIGEQVFSVEEMAHPAVLFGCPKSTIAVVGVSNDIFKFELSIRKSSIFRGKQASFLTFTGCFRKPTLLPLTKSQPSSAGGQKILQSVDLSTELVPSEIKQPFSSSAAGGVVDLLRYGVSPLPWQVHGLFEKAETFVQGLAIQREDNVMFNVFESIDRRFYMHLQAPIEAGQTVELAFAPSMYCFPTKGEEKDKALRRSIRTSLQTMKAEGLNVLVERMKTVLGAPLYDELHRVYLHRDLTGETSTLDLEHAKTVLLKYRRYNWVLWRIQCHSLASTEKNSTALERNRSLAENSVPPPWTAELMVRIRQGPFWNEQLSLLMQEEVRREVAHELSSSIESGSLFSSKDVWCPLATNLFDRALQHVTMFCSQVSAESANSLVRSLESEVVTAARRVMEISTLVEQKNREHLIELLLDYSENVHHECSCLPNKAQIAPSTSNRRYDDALALCGESGYDLSSIEELQILACRTKVAPCSGVQGLSVIGDRGVVDLTEDPCSFVKSTSTEEGAVAATTDVHETASGPPSQTSMKNVDDFDETLNTIDTKWYIERQILLIVDAVARSAVATLVGKPELEIADIRDTLTRAVRKAVDQDDIWMPAMLHTSTLTPCDILLHFPPSTETGLLLNAQPYSQPCFLRLVWPVLQKLGWELEVRNSPRTVTFLPPSKGKKKSPRALKLKKEARRRRASLASKAASLGLGDIPKDIKRLAIECSKMKSASSNERSHCAERTLADFLDMCRKSAEQDSYEKVKLLIAIVKNCFNAIAPTLLYDEEETLCKLPDQTTWCEYLGNEYLFRFLLVMPSMLPRSKLTVQEIQDTIGVSRELLKFLRTNQSTLFEPSIRIPMEDSAADDKDFPDFMVNQLKTRQSLQGLTRHDDSTVADEHKKSVFLPSDATSVTGFFATILSQVVVTHATEEETRRKRKIRIEVGHPGLVCKHCMASSNEGKYFFATLDSLNSASAVIEKHLVARCTNLPTELRKEIKRLRDLHNQERAALPPGGQTAFFNRLWKRLQQSQRDAPVEGHDMSVALSANPSRATSPATMADCDETKNTIGEEQLVVFTDHMQVLHHIVTTAPWKDRMDLQEPMRRYFEALEIGGTLCNTNAAPSHFSTEWLLSLMAPRES